MHRRITSAGICVLFLCALAPSVRAQLVARAMPEITAPNDGDDFYTNPGIDPNGVDVTCAGTGSVSITAGIPNHTYTVEWHVWLYESLVPGEGLAEHEETNVAATTNGMGYWYNSASLMAPNVGFDLGDHYLKLDVLLKCTDPNFDPDTCQVITFHVLHGD